jgi:hypothetical protein
VIRWTRTARIASGKWPEVMTWAEEIAECVSQVTGVKVQLFVQVGGPVGTLEWASDYDNMAAMEGAATKVNADATYVKLAKSAGEFLVEGSGHDTIMRSA